MIRQAKPVRSSFFNASMSYGVFVSLMQRLMAMGLNVFNQKRDLAGVSVRRPNPS